MKKFLLTTAFCLLASAAFAQQQVTIGYRNSGGGNTDVSSTNPLPITGSFSASGFAPAGNYASPLSVSNSSSNVALPTNTGTVVAYNVGSTAVYCKLGNNSVSATTSDDFIPASSAVGFSVGTNAYIACITASSTSTVNLSGGSGSLAGFGGGGASGTISVNPATVATWGLVAQGGSSAPTNALLGGCTYNSGGQTLSSGNSGALQCTSSNYLQVNVANANANGQTTMASSSPVTLASNQSVGDPCVFQTKSYADFQSSSSGGSIVTASSGKKVYVCSLSIVASAAANVQITEGTGSSVCTGGTIDAIFGSTDSSSITASHGMAFAANGGIAIGTGAGTIAASTTANQNVCVYFTTSNSPQVNVHMAYVQQ